ncbi:hypothetical protein RQP46_011170 [Phenoliferia psychrophenolica]
MRRSSQSSSTSAASMESASSLFSRADSAATGTTQEQAPSTANETRGASIRLPTRLPDPPAGLLDVDLSSLILDDGLRDVPIGYFLGKLKELGPQLMQSASVTQIQIPPGKDLPSHIACRVAPLPPNTPSNLGPISPSHVLAIKARDSERTLLLPVHGIVWAARSPGLAILSSGPSLQPASPHLPTTPAPSPSHLPVVNITLPSSLAIPFLQGWIYTSSSLFLLSSLLPKHPTPSPPPASLSPLLNPAPPPTPTTAASVAEALSHLHSKELLDRVEVVHGLWQDVVALEIPDEELWSTMSRAWSILVAALGLRERRRIERLANASESQMQPIIIIYAYSGSPFARKLIDVLVMKQLAFSQVTVDPMPPRPEFSESLGITYRRIPVLAIGNDIYLDTSLAVLALERIFPERSLSSVGRGIQTAASMFWADRIFFKAATGLLPWNQMPETFKQDRADLVGVGKIDTDAIVKQVPASESSVRSHLALIEMQLASRTSASHFFLDTPTPSYIDLSLSFTIVWIQSLPTAPAIINSFPLVTGWLIHLRSVLAAAKRSHPTNGIPKILSAAEAAGIIHSAKPAANQLLQEDDSEPLVREGWLKIGDEVEVAPDDYGRRPAQVGTLLSLTPIQS